MAYIDAYDARTGNFRDLRDLGDLHGELAERLACTHCGEQTFTVTDGDPGQPTVLHAASELDGSPSRYCRPWSDPTDDDHLVVAELDDPLDDEEYEAYEAIDSLMSELGAEAFRYGGAMIIESEWEDFAEQEAEDTGMIERDSAIRPYVDWSAWADALSQDYTSVTFLGQSYYVRAY